jgi:hypothetical protein
VHPLTLSPIPVLSDVNWDLTHGVIMNVPQKTFFIESNHWIAVTQRPKGCFVELDGKADTPVPYTRPEFFERLEYVKSRGSGRILIAIPTDQVDSLYIK